MFVLYFLHDKVSYTSLYCTLLYYAFILLSYVICSSITLDWVIYCPPPQHHPSGFKSWVTSAPALASEQAMIQDLLTIRADRDNYYYGPLAGRFFEPLGIAITISYYGYDDRYCY